MAKRAAAEPLEDVVPAASPASKRARVQDVADEDLPPPPPPPPPPEEPRARANGRSRSEATPDILDADTQLHEELEEAGASSDDSAEEETPSSRQNEASDGYADLYLDSITRSALDFDFLRQCSVTLSNHNVYACLVCGKYFSGRGVKTPAYFHALDIGHHVYINMESKKVYVLPEGYEVKSKSLDDIKFVVDPTFTPEMVKALDTPQPPSWDLSGTKYHPGFVGLNNIKANDYLNVVAQALSHVPPLRNFLLLADLSAAPAIAHQFSILVRKLWNPRAFKPHVSPHELMQEIALRSNKKFLLTTQSDPLDFLAWFLNTLHLALGGSKTKPHSSLIQKFFQGQLRQESQTITARADATDRLQFEDAPTKTVTTPFTILTLDLPAAPLFQDTSGTERKNIIPQVALTTVLQKYNGITSQERMNTRLRYRLLHPLPPYLIMHVKRFLPNKFLTAQRNPTIVTFSPRSLDMSPYVEPNPSLHSPGEPVVYDLVANISYEGVKVRDDSVEGEAERRVWKAQVREGKAAAGEDVRWWELQDLFVGRTEGELLGAKESYCMVWERRKTKGKGKGKV